MSNTRNANKNNSNGNAEETMTEDFDEERQKLIWDAAEVTLGKYRVKLEELLEAQKEESDLLKTHLKECENREDETMAFLSRTRGKTRTSLQAQSSNSESKTANDWDATTLGFVRVARAAAAITSIALDYRLTIYSNHGLNVESPEYIAMRSNVHQRSADRLLDMCRRNGGVYIKVGQHVAAMEHLLPDEFVDTMKSLQSGAPESSMKEVRNVVRNQFGRELEEIFPVFEQRPVGAASLAQVHRARTMDGKDCAVKVQHEKVEPRSHLDIISMDILVKIVAKIFPTEQERWTGKTVL
ncbi:unnamed protein product [Cyprideis torosa]|uniref:ABC1 atypical kinase-like domain-containing protein n=1 Tax=Cyprideis torosa TaxID=163714 RepID=A0A7R8W6Z8_9CRUS|nr:unnamed protein product [Cyprideis torosa]CAG0881626.1 unnamed protein product [Cyprideis torosa]